MRLPRQGLWLEGKTMEKFGAILAAFSLVSALFSGFAGAADVNSVTVCKGEQAAFEFQLHNKVDPLT